MVFPLNLPTRIVQLPLVLGVPVWVTRWLWLHLLFYRFFLWFYLSEATYRKCKLSSAHQVTHDTKLCCFDLPEGCRMCVPLGHHVHIRASVEGILFIVDQAAQTKNTFGGWHPWEGQTGGWHWWRVVGWQPPLGTPLPPPQKEKASYWVMGRLLPSTQHKRHHHEFCFWCTLDHTPEAEKLTEMECVRHVHKKIF